MNLLWVSVCFAQMDTQTIDDFPQIKQWYETADQNTETVLDAVDSILTNHIESLSDTEITYLYYTKSDCHYYLDDLRKSDEAILKALAHIPDDFDAETHVDILNIHGQNLDFFGELSEAIDYYEKGIRIAKKIKDSTRVNELYYNIALTYFTLTQLDESLLYMDSSQHLSILLKDSTGISGLLRVRSSIYKMEGQIDKAINTSQEGLQYISYEDPAMRCFHLLDIANSYYSMGVLDSLYKYALLGKQCTKTYDYGFAKLEAFKVFANYYKETKDTANAIKVLDSLIVAAESIGNMQEYYFGLISKYTFVIENEQLDEAIKAAEKAEEMGLERLAMIGFEKIAYELSELGNYQKAYTYLNRSNTLKSKFTKEDSRRQTEIQAAKFKVFEEEAKAKLAEEKLKSRQAQFITFGILGVSLFALLVAWIIFRNKRAKLLLEQERLNQETELLREIADVESQAFRAQMNPHFIFNALNSIKGLIVNKQDKEAALYISKFSKLVRNVLDNSRSKMIALADELATLEMYIKLEQMRFRDGFDYEIHIDPNLELDTIQIPPVTIQPFVENAIWHGFKNNPRSNKLEIRIREKNEELYISIQDNGVGRPSNTPQAVGRKSHGIDITKQRILNFSNDKEFDRLQYHDLKDQTQTAIGTLVQIRIPINYKTHE